MADAGGKTQAAQLQELRECLGESTFQRIQREVWQMFSPTAPPFTSDGTLTPLALYSIWDELLEALQVAVARQARERQTATQTAATDRPLWEVLKNGIKWSATLKVQNDFRSWEVVIIRNDKRAYAERFLDRDRAEAWADKECIEISMGWKE